MKNILSIFLGAVLLLSCQNNITFADKYVPAVYNTDQTAPAQFDDDIKKFSFYLGMNYGASLQQGFPVALNTTNFFKSLDGALSGESTDTVIKMDAIQFSTVLRKAGEEFQAKSQEATSKYQAILEEKYPKETLGRTTIHYQIISAGSGDAIKASDKVKVAYTMYNIYGDITKEEPESKEFVSASIADRNFGGFITKMKPGAEYVLYAPNVIIDLTVTDIQQDEVIELPEKPQSKEE